MWWLALGTALAGSEGWVLSESGWLVDEPFAIEREGSDFEVDRGYAFRIEDGGVAVGAVFVGTGTWEVSFETHSDAVVAANRMAVLEGADPEELRPSVDHGEPLQIGIDRGWMVGLDVWHRLEPSLLEVTQQGGALYGERDGIDEIVVTQDIRLARARRIADEALRERTAWMRTHLFDPASLLVVDAWDGEIDVWMADFRTDRAWDRFAGVDTAGADQRWLSAIHEPDGALRQDLHTAVFAAVSSDRGVDLENLAVGRHAPDDLGRRRAPERVDLVDAAARHAFRIEAGATAVIKESHVDLAVEAVGADQQVVWIDVPHTHQKTWGTEPPLTNGWRLDDLTLADGTPVEAMHLPLTGSQTEGRGSVRTIAVRLPEPLAAGEQAVLRVSWTDRHRYNRFLTLDMNGKTQVFHLGTNTNLLAALPRVRGDGGRDFRAEVEVGIQKLGNHQSVVSGVSEERWTDEQGWRWVRGWTNSRRAVIAAGIWDLDDRPGGPRYPEIQTALRGRGPDAGRHMSSQIRKLVALYQQILPTFPNERIQMLELVASMGQWLIQGADEGVIGLGSYREMAVGMGPEADLRRNFPHYEERAIASVLAMHWFSDRHLAGDELALVEVVGPAMGLAAIEAQYGAEPADKWVEAMRNCADPSDRVVGPVSKAGPNGHCAGIHLVAQGLPNRVGRPVVNAALGRMLAGDFPATFDGFQAALEDASGTSLAGFFDIWVHGGVAPDVEVLWHHDPSGFVRGTATSNLPFGTLEFPIRIDEVDVRIRMIDGQATFEIPWTGPPPKKLRVDPDDALLFRNTQAVQQAVPMA